MKTTEQILEEARLEYKPSLIVCCYSGGYDSMVATHRTLAWARQYQIAQEIVVASVDTQIHADGWLEFVRSSAAKIGAGRFEIWQSKRFGEWKTNINKFGFGYTKYIHTIFFRQLKEAAFQAMLAPVSYTHLTLPTIYSV